MEYYPFIIDAMTWSFTRLKADCLYEFKLHYIDCEHDEDSFYGAAGSWAHEVLEKYIKGELEVYELSMVYEEGFDEHVPMWAPYSDKKDIKAEYIAKVVDYFDNIDLELEKYEVLGVEKKLNFIYHGHEFIGYIDVLLRDKATDAITILDHKSGSLRFLKDGSVSKSQKDQQHLLEFKRQLYMYSRPIIEEYGRVDYLQWNLFKDRNWLTIPWNQKEYVETWKWVDKTIDDLKHRTEWPPLKDYGKAYYCRNLCGLKRSCKYFEENQREYKEQKERENLEMASGTDASVYPQFDYIGSLY